jgi:nucleoside-diphosphate-sugar epimerase
MKVLVTGGGGFLGAWTIKRLLARGQEVRVFDASMRRDLARSLAGPQVDRLEWRIGDITTGPNGDVEAAMTGCDAVVHLAGLLTPACQDDPILGARVNLVGTLNVFEAAKRLGLRKVIYTSSVSVFGPDNGEIPFPDTHYGAFKLACEGCARTYWSYDRLSSIGFRPAVVYGPGRETGLTAGVSLACRAAVRGERFTIGFTGATNLVYADDVAAAFEAALFTDLEGAHVFNATGTEETVDAVVAAIKLRRPGADIMSAGAGVPFCPTIGKDAMRDLLPGISTTSLQHGIALTLDFYEQSERRARD